MTPGLPNREIGLPRRGNGVVYPSTGSDTVQQSGGRARGVAGIDAVEIDSLSQVDGAVALPSPVGAIRGVFVRLPEGVLGALDAWAEKAGISRSEAVRQLIEAGLKRKRG